jgi:hypothetical protein
VVTPVAAAAVAAASTRSVPAPAAFARAPITEDAAEIEGGGAADDLLYCIKWKGWSHLHNSWHTAAALLAMDISGTKKLTNYMSRWTQTERLLSVIASEEREVVFLQRSMQAEMRAQHCLVERVIDMRPPSADVAEPSYLCKWNGLPYGECTWELASHIAPFQKEIDAYLARAASRTRPKAPSSWRVRPAFRRIVTQPSWLGNGTPATQLRDYQLIGLNWLASAWCRENSVILADEMGLGKTVQTISFLSYLFHVCKVYGPFLVVVPLSTLMAWQREFVQWAADINLVAYVGDRRSREIIRQTEFFDSRGHLKVNAVLTTYETVLSDFAELSQLKWAVLAVDEAHRLKNDVSQLHQTLSALQTGHRLLITGTPLQVALWRAILIGVPFAHAV